MLILRTVKWKRGPFSKIWIRFRGIRFVEQTEQKIDRILFCLK